MVNKLLFCQSSARRDAQTASSYWTGRHVAILGCGAIGSAVAMLLARAGVSKLQLYDRAVVKPGILVRQLFDRYQIGTGKAAATAKNARLANPNVECVYYGNVIVALRDPERLASLLDADVIINATAATTVAFALERHFRDWPKKHPAIVSMSLGHNADFGMATLSVESQPGVALDLDRRSKVAFANAPRAKAVLDEFWPIDPERNQLFQPEPGCSDPTFKGSAADVVLLASRMTNISAVWLAQRSSSRVYAIDMSPGHRPKEFSFDWPADEVLIDARNGYQVRLSQTAQAALQSWMRRSERVRGPRDETGGLLFGHVDEFLKIIWVDEVSGPPPDSKASPNGFTCGIEGVAALNQEKSKRTRGSTAFVGMWHTHPLGEPTPSFIDRNAMAELLQDKAFLGKRFLMLIVGGAAAKPNISVNVFERRDYHA